MKTTVKISMWLLLAALLLWVAAPAQAAKAKSKAKSGDDLETLEEYIADLQKNPGNEAQRIKIINLVLEMKRPPAVPEEAKRSMAYGTAAMKGARSEADFKEAVTEFQKAANAAPWWANAYYNLGVAQDKAGQVAAAIKSLNLYLQAAPEARDTEKVKQLVYEMEYRQKKGVKGFSPDTDFKAWLARLNGSRWLRGENADAKEYYELNGDMITQWVYFKTVAMAPIGQQPGTKNPYPGWPLSVKSDRTFVYNDSDHEFHYEISEDGEVITCKTVRHPFSPIGQVGRFLREK